MAESEHVHHHHHHSHHHHSDGTGSTSGSPSIYKPSGDSYSVRSFGKASQSKVLPEGTLSVAVFSSLVTALVIAPVVISLLFRNKALNERIDELRDEMGRMIEAAEEQGAAVMPGQSAAKARRVVAVSDPEPQPAPRVAERKPDTSLANRFIDVDAVASAVDMTKEEIASLRNSISLFPDGMRCDTDDSGRKTLSADELYTRLRNGYNYLALGQKHDAAGTFGMIAGEMPQWPYAHFFLALSNHDQTEMVKANTLFTTARAIGAQTVESELYGALTSLFLKSNVAAEIVISRLVDSHDGKEELHMGPIFVPKTAPDDVLRMLRKIRGIGEIREVEW